MSICGVEARSGRILVEIHSSEGTAVELGVRNEVILAPPSLPTPVWLLDALLHRLFLKGATVIVRFHLSRLMVSALHRFRSSFIEA